MDWPQAPHTVMLATSAAISAGLAAYAWRSRATPGARPFSVMMGALAWWCLALLVQVASDGFAAKMVWLKVQYLGVVVVPYAWLLFALAYAGRDNPFGTTSRAVLGLTAATTVALALTNEAHGLLWSRAWLDEAGPSPMVVTAKGPWFWVHVAYAYTLLAVGTLVLAPRAAAASSLYRGQALALLAGVIAPWLANVVFLLGLTRRDGTPFALTLSGLAFGWGLFRYRLLDLVPLARDAVLDGMDAAMLVADARGRVVDVNASGRRLLGPDTGEPVGRPLAEVLAPWPEVARLAAHVGRFEPTVDDARGRRHLEVTVSPLLEAGGLRTGTVLVCRDITESRNAADELRAQRRMFAHLVAVARATTQRPTLEATLQNTLEVSAQITGAEGGSLTLFDEQAHITHALFVRGGVSEVPPQDLTRIVSSGLAAWVRENRQSALVADTHQDSRWIVLPEQESVIRAALVVPIEREGTLLGILALDHSRPGHFEAEHLRLIEAAADQIGLALRNAQIFDEHTRLAERQTMLYDLLRAMGAQTGVDGVASRAVEAIGHFTGWPGIVIATEGETREQWLVRANSRRFAPPGRTFRGGVVGRVFATGRTELLSDVAADPEYLTADPSVKSELAVPLRRGARVLGVLNLESDRVAAFGPEDVKLAESIAEAVALAMENALLYETAEEDRTRLQAVIETSRDGIVFVDLDRCIRVFNEQARRMLHLEGRSEDWLGKPVDDVLQALIGEAPHVVEMIKTELRRMRRGDEPAGTGEYELPPHLVRWVTLPVGTGSTALGRLVVLRDVTEERTLGRMRDDLTHTMVHDLRNPLTSIDATVQAFQLSIGGTLSASQQEMLRVAARGVQRLKTLVDAILDVSRLEAGKMPLEREKVALSPLVSDTLRLQEPLAREAGQRLASDVSAELPPVWADPSLVTRILQNLVGNALKFSPAGGAVRVSASLTGRNGSRAVAIAVSDDGPGLSPDIEPRLFQKFATGRHQARGSGLGLAFCRLAVEAHGGGISALSRVGGGSTFTFTLPVAEA